MSTRDKPMRLGVVCSAGGSVLRELCRLQRQTPFNIEVVTDRQCVAEEVCGEFGVGFQRIEEKDKNLFSHLAAEHFCKKGGVDAVLLFFTRLVSNDLFMVFPTLNFHPSLLPAFKGFKPLEQAVHAGVKIIGATLHVVDESMDGGSIIAQVSNTVRNYEMAYLGKLSFLQKTLLAYLLVDLLLAEDISFNGKEPSVRRVFAGERGCMNLAIKNQSILEIFHRTEEENNLRIT